MKNRIVVFLAFILVGLFHPLYSFAQSENTYSVEIAQDEIDSYINATSDGCETPSLECLVKNTVTFTMIELTHNIIGDGCALAKEGTNCTEVGGPAAQNRSINDASQEKNRGVVGDLVNFISKMYAEPPATTSMYVADVLNSAHIATPAYAQGVGFSALNPILDLWKRMRNVAYIGFILIFVVIGFMIMFRAKIGGQSAVTAQQAIPNVIVSLIFVTFSYAIAGLAIDFMYLTMFMLVGLFQGNLPAGVNTNIIDQNIFGLGGMIFWPAAGPDAFFRNSNIISNILSNSIDPGSTTGTVEQILGFAGGLTISLILSIAILIQILKLFFELLKSYASIILNIVLAPIILMSGALPGANPFLPWLKSIIGNLAAFPAVLVMIIIFYEFIDLGNSQAVGGFMPPFLLGQDVGSNALLAAAMGLAVILALPELVKKVKEAMGAKDGFGMQIAKDAWGQFGQGARYAAPTYGALIGGAGGAIMDSGKARSRGPLAMFSSAVSGARRGAGEGIRRGNSLARTASQIAENKYFDPNSWENVLLKQQSEREKERAEERAKLRDRSKATPG